MFFDPVEFRNFAVGLKGKEWWRDCLGLHQSAVKAARDSWSWSRISELNVNKVDLERSSQLYS